MIKMLEAAQYFVVESTNISKWYHFALNLYRRGGDFIFMNLVYFLEFRFNLRFYWLLKRINVIYRTYHTKWESFYY